MGEGGAGLSNGIKKEVKDDYSIAERFGIDPKSILLQTYHNPISRREDPSSSALEGDSIF
jgi:hypothetical protein